MTTHVLAIAGSLRRDSYNGALVRAARDAAPDGVEVEIWEGLGDLPHYDADQDAPEPPPAVAALRAAVAAADAVLIATPEYNGSIPGVLKNAVDWLSRPFPGGALYGRPVAVAGATTGQFGAVWAQEDLRKVLRIAGARVLPDGVSVAKCHTLVTEDGGLADAGIHAELTALLGRLVAEAQPVAA